MASLQHNRSKVFSIRDQITQQMRIGILSGEFVPAQRLNEQELAKRFGVSRGPVRDAIIQLTTEGLLISKKNYGTTVNDLVDDELLSVLLSLKLKIESYAVNQCIDKLTKKDLAYLDTTYTSMANAMTSKDDVNLNQSIVAFYQYLIDKAGGEQLVNLWFPIVMRTRLNRTTLFESLDHESKHGNLLGALQACDKDSALAALTAINSIE